MPIEGKSPRTRPPEVDSHVDCQKPVHADFDSHVRPHLESMFRLARRVLGCNEAAWDAVQEVIVRLWESGDMPPDTDGVWLRRVTWNRSLDMLRGARRRASRVDAETSPESLACSSNPGHRIELDEMRRSVCTAIESLPVPFRDVVALHALDDLNHEEVARELELPPGTVRSRLHRARELLAQRLRHVVDDERLR